MVNKQRAIHQCRHFTYLDSGNSPFSSFSLAGGGSFLLLRNSLTNNYTI